MFKLKGKIIFSYDVSILKNNAGKNDNKITKSHKLIRIV